MYENKQLFDFMQKRVEEIARHRALDKSQAFPWWFAEMYFQRPKDIIVSDGSGDGKVDLFFKTDDGTSVQYQVINAKFTERYNRKAPAAFYDELTRFWQAFQNKARRGDYLKSVRHELRTRYRNLFQRYDEGNARLMFLTNFSCNDRQYNATKPDEVDVFHLEDVLQFMIDHIEGAMPRTPQMLLTGISDVLSPDRRDTEVPTSIVFARLADFMEYMQGDLFELLFARNVRLSLGNTPVNKEIKETFRNSPKEFVFSNNGITMLCEKLTHDPGSRELRIENPRIVNGAQTLHSCGDVEGPSPNARVMVRIIQVSPLRPDELPKQVTRRKDIIQKISIRSNRQNPIKKWDLVSNDDFQMELARFFRSNGFFYERRQKEWNSRKTDLKSVGIGRGPNITQMAQLISSFNFRQRSLGPALAKASKASLFEDRAYRLIRGVSPELAYQIYLLHEIVDWCYPEPQRSAKYMKNVRRHVNLTLFSVVVRAFKKAGAKWGTPELTERLDLEYDDPNRACFSMVEEAVRRIYRFYKNDDKAHRRAAGMELTFNNYFKSQAHVGKIFRAPAPRKLTALARRILSCRKR